MVKIKELTPRTIELKGINVNDEEAIEKILSICHKHKHRYKDGHNSGKEAREDPKNLKRWSGCPGVCFVYLIGEGKEQDTIIIRAMVSHHNSIKKFTEVELDHFRQLYTQDVADEVIAAFG